MIQGPNPIDLAKETWKEYSLAKGARLAAALAYYTFTSFFPLLLVLISLIGLALNLGLPVAQGARSYVLDTITTTLPAANDIITENLRELETKSGTIGIIGLLTGLWAASNIFKQLEEAFNQIFHSTPPQRSFVDNLIARGQAAGIVVLVALLMLASLIFSTVIKTLEEFALLLPGGPTIAWLMNLGLSLLLTTAVFSALFRYLPDKPVTWRAAIVGGLFTSIAWQIGRELLTWYLARASGVTAGTVVGSVLAFLVLIYYAAQILLVGAGVTATYDKLSHPQLEQDVSVEKREAPSASEAPALAVEENKAVPFSSRAVSFGVGFFTAMLSVLIGMRALLGRFLQRVRRV